MGGAKDSVVFVLFTLQLYLYFSTYRYFTAETEKSP
jgi:hypothetical protein